MVSSGAAGGVRAGMTCSPGTFSAAGAKRPPSSIPPGSGRYSSIAIWENGDAFTPAWGLAIVSDAIAMTGPSASVTSASGFRDGGAPGKNCETTP